MSGMYLGKSFNRLFDLSSKVVGSRGNSVAFLVGCGQHGDIAAYKKLICK